MALRDVSFYRFLIEALRYKLRNRKVGGYASTASGQRFTLTYGQIFFYARKLFPQFYNRRFPNTDEGNLKLAQSLIDRLDKGQDQELEKYLKVESAPTESEAFHKQLENDIAQSQKEVEVNQPETLSAQTQSNLPKPTSQTPSTQPQPIPTTVADQTPSTAHQTTPIEQPQTPAQAQESFVKAPTIPPEASSASKNVGSNLAILFKRNLGKYLTPQLILSAFSGIVGMVTGWGVLGGPLGGVLGLGGGVIAPTLIRGGAARSLAGAGGQALDFGGRLSNNFSTLPTPQLSKKAALIAIILVFVLVFVLAATAPFQSPDQQPPTPPSQPVTTVSGSIASCQFVRSDQNPKIASFKSPLLLNFIQEASQLTGIPAAVLAAFIRVESPSSINLTDQQIANLSCARSVTGALGIMQIQPPGTRGHDQGAVSNGARLLGLNYNQLTEVDFCDVRKNIVLGSGFVLKKMSYFGFGDGTRWDPSWTNNRDAIYSLVRGYYGCLEYGGANPLRCEGPYNYGDDVWNSVQSCQPTETNLVNVGVGTDGALSQIVSFASQIIPRLQKGAANMYNRKADEGITGTGDDLYWCTFLIADSYTKAGYTGLDRLAHAAVLRMKDFFASAPGYKLLPATTLVNQLNPGDVIFFEGLGIGAQHVSLIKAIEIDRDGDGAIKTYDSNNVVTEDVVFVRNYQATKAQTTARRYSITGFGQLVR